MQRGLKDCQEDAFPASSVSCLNAKRIESFIIGSILFLSSSSLNAKRIESLGSDRHVLCRCICLNAKRIESFVIVTPSCLKISMSQCKEDWKKV